MAGREDKDPAAKDSCCIELAKLGVGVDIYRSKIDGAVVVHIDTNEELLPCDAAGPTGLRVYINDDTDNPVYNSPGPDGPRCDCDIGEACEVCEGEDTLGTEPMGRDESYNRSQQGDVYSEG